MVRTLLLGGGLVSLCLASAPALALTTISDVKALPAPVEAAQVETTLADTVEFEDDGLSAGETIFMLLGSLAFSVMLLGRKPD